MTSYQVTAKAAGHAAITRTVGPTATSAVLAGLKNRLTYTVTVTAQTNGQSAGARDKLYPTTMTLRAKPRTVHRGRKAVLRGTLSSIDRQMHLAQHKVAIWAKPRGHKWAQIATVRTARGGVVARGGEAVARTS